MGGIVLVSRELPFETWQAHNESGSGNVVASRARGG